MTLSHPIQGLTPETLKWLMRWSRILFWVVLGLYAYIKFSSMPCKNTTETILATPPEELGALGFWAGYDYLFMLAYTLFFTVCCIWGAGLFKTGSFLYNLGIALAWAMIPLLLIDMAENWCTWQIALGNPGASIGRMMHFLKPPKEALFVSAAGYAAVLQVLRWVRVM